jgi:hypothetical protein
MTALAALVPCADDGIRQTSRCVSPGGSVVGADRQQAGELALAAGVGLQRDRVVAGDLDSQRSSSGSARPVAGGLLDGANGCSPANSGQVIGSISWPR